MTLYPDRCLLRRPGRGTGIASAGAEVRVATCPGMSDGFWRHPDRFDAAEEALADAAAFLAQHV